MQIKSYLSNGLHMPLLWSFGRGSDAKVLLVFVKTDVKINEKYFENHIFKQIKFGYKNTTI